MYMYIHAFTVIKYMYIYTGDMYSKGRGVECTNSPYIYKECYAFFKYIQMSFCFTLYNISTHIYTSECIYTIHVQ